MVSHIRSQIACLRRLSADLEGVEAGGGFASALKASPVLYDWRNGLRRVGCLEGVVEGHPSIPDGHFVSTSEVWAYFQEQDERFVRTLNRWYRLDGRPRTADGSAEGLTSIGDSRR